MSCETILQILFLTNELYACGTYQGLRGTIEHNRVLRTFVKHVKNILKHLPNTLDQEDKLRITELYYGTITNIYRYFGKARPVNFNEFNLHGILEASTLFAGVQSTEVRPVDISPIQTLSIIDMIKQSTLFQEFQNDHV